MDGTNDTNATPSTSVDIAGTVVDRAAHYAREEEILLALTAISRGIDAKAYLEQRLVTVKKEAL